MPSKFFFIILFAIAGSLCPAAAQKAFKPVKTALKDKKYGEAAKQVQTLRKDTLWKDNPKLAVFNIEAQRGLNDAENMKLYLKRNYDTLALFSTTLQIVKECVWLDSLERAQEKSGNGKRHNRRFIVEQLQRYFPNLHAASRFLYSHAKYAEAMPYLEVCINLPHSPLGKEAHLQARSETNNAVLYMSCAYNSKQFGLVKRFQDLALSDSLYRSSALQCLSLTSETTNDTVSLHKWLEQGWTEYPREPFFFLHLADFFTQRKDYNEVLRVARAQYATDSTSQAVLMAGCNAAFHLENFELCTQAALKLMKSDSLNAEAYYYAGASQAALANAVILPDNINSSAYRKAMQQKHAYALKAEPWLEQFRAMAPNEQKRWAPLLYQVYLTLNRGKKFAEIDALMGQ